MSSKINSCSKSSERTPLMKLELKTEEIVAAAEALGNRTQTTVAIRKIETPCLIKEMTSGIGKISAKAALIADEAVTTTAAASMGATLIRTIAEGAMAGIAEIVVIVGIAGVAEVAGIAGIAEIVGIVEIVRMVTECKAARKVANAS